MLEKGRATLLRIFLGELDKIGHRTLYEAILLSARKEGMAGCTVLKGILSYGASTRIHTSRLIDISEDLPIIVEIVDTEEKIDRFLPFVNALFDECGRGGLITLEKVDVLYYESKK
jgi:PII-like signaling protein